MKSSLTKMSGAVAILIWVSLGCTPELSNQSHQTASSSTTINEIKSSAATIKNIAATLRKADVDQAIQNKDRVTLKRWLHQINPEKYPNTVLYIQNGLQAIRME